METLRTPFQHSRSRPGIGNVHVDILPPNTPTYKVLNYSYPLKLISSSSHFLNRNNQASWGTKEPHLRRIDRVPLLFMLTYGGGLLPGDSIDLNVELESLTRLTIATQGSTKVFPSSQNPSGAEVGRSTRASLASQHLSVLLNSQSALVLIPDPVQPFQSSHYSQIQIFTLDQQASLALVDWVASGRPAREEVWDVGNWIGRNEIWQVNCDNNQACQKRPTKQLLLRDALYLEGGPDATSIQTLRMEGKGILGTMLLVGPIFEALSTFILNEFAYQRKIGGCDWDDHEDDKPSLESGSDSDRKRMEDDLAHWRRKRQAWEQIHDVIWTATRLRGVTVVKFASREAEGARSWLNDMLTYDGTIEREFGPGGLLAVR